MLRSQNPIFIHLKSFLSSPIDYIASWAHLHNETDASRWANGQNIYYKWDERTALMAAMIPPNSSVFEFGAGKELLGTLLPQGCHYQPCDIVPGSDRTLLHDLNISFPPMDRVWDYMVFSGVLEYIRDIPSLLNNVRAHSRNCILSYGVTDGLECLITRRKSGWFNHFSEKDFEKILHKCGFTIAEKRIWEKQIIYRLHS